jgi:hypothetical protein
VGSNYEIEPQGKSDSWELGPLQHPAVIFQQKFSRLDDVLAAIPEAKRTAVAGSMRVALVLEGSQADLPCLLSVSYWSRRFMPPPKGVLDTIERFEAFMKMINMRSISSTAYYYILVASPLLDRRNVIGQMDPEVYDRFHDDHHLRIWLRWFGTHESRMSQRTVGIAPSASIWPCRASQQFTGREPLGLINSSAQCAGLNGAAVLS